MTRTNLHSVKRFGIPDAFDIIELPSGDQIFVDIKRLIGLDSRHVIHGGTASRATEIPVAVVG